MSQLTRVNDPTPWYERSPTAVAAGALGIFLLASIVFAVITVSDHSTRSPGSVTPLPSVTTSSNPTAVAPPPPIDPAQPTPPTVTETVTTEKATTQAPVPGPPRGARWRQLFPRLFGGR
jgi:hypothetical protein